MIVIPLEFEAAIEQVRAQGGFRLVGRVINGRNVVVVKC